MSSLSPSSRESTLLNLLNFHPIYIFLEALGFFDCAFFCLRILLFLFLENWGERARCWTKGMMSSLSPSSRESTLLNLLNFHPICIFLEALGFFVGAFFCLRILLFLFLENWEERGERKGSVSREGSRRLELSSSRSNGYDKMGNVIWK